MYPSVDTRRKASLQSHMVGARERHSQEEAWISHLWHQHRSPSTTTRISMTMSLKKTTAIHGPSSALETHCHKDATLSTLTLTNTVIIVHLLLHVYHDHIDVLRCECVRGAARYDSHWLNASRKASSVYCFRRRSSIACHSLFEELRNTSCAKLSQLLTLRVTFCDTKHPQDRMMASGAEQGEFLSHGASIGLHNLTKFLNQLNSKLYREFGCSWCISKDMQWVQRGNEGCARIFRGILVRVCM